MQLFPLTKIILFSLAAFMFFSCSHIRKALWYGKADIDDYKIFKSKIIKADKPQPWLVNSKSSNLQLSEKSIQNLQKYKTVSFLVIKDHQILFEKYFEKHKATSISNNFSVTKSIVSLLLGMAIQEKKINDVDQKAKDFLPWLNQGLSAELTIRHLITMSAGINFDEKYANLFSATTKAYYGRNLRKMTESFRVIHQPGIQNVYQSGSTQLLALILEKATGRSISEYAQTLWTEMGAETDALWCLDKENGMEKAFCCFCSTARDLARFGKVILEKGKINNKQIVSEDFIKNAITPANYLKDKDGNNVDYYGFHWWIIKFREHTIPYARGVNGQYLFIIPEKNAIVVRQGHLRSKERQGWITLDIFDILNAAFEIIDAS